MAEHQNQREKVIHLPKDILDELNGFATDFGNNYHIKLKISILWNWNVNRILFPVYWIPFFVFFAGGSLIKVAYLSKEDWTNDGCKVSLVLVNWEYQSTKFQKICR